MNHNEIVICAGPQTGYSDAVLAALNDEGISARTVAIADVEQADRPLWACSPGDEILVIVPESKRDAALGLIRWIYRVCLNCETFLLPKVRTCQRCGTPHSMEPGPFLDVPRVTPDFSA
jgi:hypothetical protein